MICYKNLLLRPIFLLFSLEDKGVKPGSINADLYMIGMLLYAGVTALMWIIIGLELYRYMVVFEKDREHKQELIKTFVAGIVLLVFPWLWSTAMWLLTGEFEGPVKFPDQWFTIVYSSVMITYARENNLTDLIRGN